jgi:hypothetical protein
MAILALIFGIAYLPLQAVAWMKWKGAWFYLSIVPAGIPVMACAVGLAKDSNLWPFWGAFALPGSTFLLGAIWCCRWFVQKTKGENA